MKVVVDLLSAGEVATILRVKLGTLKAWRDFLADCIRKRQQLHGLRLLPYAKLHVGEGRIGRPLYRREDVDQFVSDVRRASGVAAVEVRIEPMRVSLDNTPGVPWRLRRAMKVKPPLPSLSTSLIAPS